MRDSGDIETQCILAVDLNEWRPALRPFCQPLEKRGIAFGISKDGNQSRVQRAGIGQPSANPRSARRRCFRNGMDDRPVRALDGEDDGIFRR